MTNSTLSRTILKEPVDLWPAKKILRMARATSVILAVKSSHRVPGSKVQAKQNGNLKQH